MSSPLHQLPAGYTEVRHVVLTESRLLLRLNLLSLLPLALMLIWMALWWGLVSPGRASVPAPDIPWWLSLIAILLVVFPLHELLHGLAIRCFGHHARYGAKLSKGVLYATAENALFRRHEYLIVALAPVVLITLAAMLLMRLVPAWLAYYLALAAVINAGGAVGDLWAARVVSRYSPRALVRDEADGFRVYEPAGAAGSSTQNSAPPSAG